MSIRRAADARRARESDESTADDGLDGTEAARPHTGPLTDRPRSLAEAEERYVTVRDEWIAAMRRAATGRPADLASLAIRQEAYEIAAAEVERWRSAPHVAIPIDPEPKRTGIEVAIGQEMAWKRVHERSEEPEPNSGPVARFLRRALRR